MEESREEKSLALSQYFCCVVLPCFVVPALLIRSVTSAIRATELGFSACEMHDRHLYYAYFVATALLFLLATNIFGLCLVFTLCHRPLKRSMRIREKGEVDLDSEDDWDNSDEEDGFGIQRQIMAHGAAHSYQGPNEP